MHASGTQRGSRFAKRCSSHGGLAMRRGGFQPLKVAGTFHVPWLNPSTTYSVDGTRRVPATLTQDGG